MNNMRLGRKKRSITRGIARALTASLLFGIIGSHAEALTITAWAQEDTEEYDYSMVEGGGALSLGGGHSAIIKRDGSLWMWGDNTYGQLGNGTTVDSKTPVSYTDQEMKENLLV